MTDNTLIERTLQSYLDQVGGSYVKAYEEIVADEERRVLAAKPRSNAELRRAAYAKAVKNLDRKQLASMNKTVRNFLPLAKANSAITAETGVLTLDQAEDLMIEVLEVKRLQEIAKSRYEEIRKRVFNSITESFAEQGEEFPEHLAGFIEIPKMGLKFTREGGSRKEPELDEDKLAELVGPEVWEQVTTVEVVETRHFDPDLFLELARSKPKLLEQLRSALKVGAFGTSSFHQRAMEPDE